MNINESFRNNPGSDADPRDTNDWPLVAHNDDGIRPAGEPDECFYCNQEVGNPHGEHCVMVTKKVRVMYTVEAVIEVPHNWEPDQIVGSENDGGWQYNVAEWGTAEFDSVKTSYIGVEADYPRRKLQEPAGE